MKKIALGLLILLMLAGPAMAAPVRSKPAKAKIGGAVAPRTAAGYRMNAAINRAGSSKRGAALPSERTRTQPKPPSNIGSELSAGSFQFNGPTPPPSGDKPFAVGASAVNPFAPPGSFPGSLWSPPVPLASGINPFQPIASSVNPFRSTGWTAELPAPAGAGFSVPAAANNPVGGGKTVPVTQKVTSSPNPLRSPWSTPLPGKASLALTPASSPLPFFPAASPRNPFSPADTSSSGSPFRLPTTP